MCYIRYEHLSTLSNMHSVGLLTRKDPALSVTAVMSTPAPYEQTKVRNMESLMYGVHLVFDVCL
jgi:hypothetical protein